MSPKDPYKDEIQTQRISLEDKRNREYRKLFSSPTGRWVFLDMCHRYMILKPKGEVALNPQGLAYSAGTQAVFEDILERLNKNPMEIKQEMAEFNG